MAVNGLSKKSAGSEESDPLPVTGKRKTATCDDNSDDRDGSAIAENTGGVTTVRSGGTVGISGPAQSSLCTRDASGDAPSGELESVAMNAPSVSSASAHGGNKVYPDKSRFDVLLGMLTIATMVGVGGAAGTIAAQVGLRKSNIAVREGTVGKWGGEEDKDKEEEGGEEGEEEEDEEGGMGSRGGNKQAEMTGQGIIAVLDDGHEMDHRSFDLLKARSEIYYEDDSSFEKAFSCFS